MTRIVCLLVFPGVQSLDVSGPMDVFAEANRFLPADDRYQLEVVGSEAGLLACSNGLLIQAQCVFREATGQYDLLLVAGGPPLVHQDLGEDLHAWLRSAVLRSRRFGSICNGTFILARAGLIGDRTVTTHWNDAPALAELCPSARLEVDRLYIQHGSLYTSAGVTAGIDLSLYLLAQDHGAEVALNVAKRLVMFVQRGGGQSQFSPYLTPYVEPTSPVAHVQQYVLGHLGKDLSVAVLARVANMSPRNFSRIFVRDTKLTPAGFVESARVDAARVMLEDGTTPIKRIAYECGFGDAHNMRHVFKRRFGVSPRQYRLNFSSPTVGTATQG
ncbi:helix-turn-helix domain-containing protein [Paraburkholderia sp. IMGN_8]|uniref:GlxA family transcriptional regulator n=1 Tax=Paraburkholderia sp. IMGN_8 TaxID=3136564 RepID=UPI0031010452